MDRLDDEIFRKMLKRISEKVSFKYPGKEGQRNGVLKDRIAVRSNPNTSGVPYWTVIDLIEFPEEQEKEWMRFGYYRKPFERLVWGSQTTLTESIKAWKSLFVKAAREKPWFRELLDEVMNELRTDSQSVQN